MDKVVLPKVCTEGGQGMMITIKVNIVAIRKEILALVVGEHLFCCQNPYANDA